MDWDKLRVFYHVAEAGSFTKAGEQLNLSQSAVSRQISALEDSQSACARTGWAPYHLMVELEDSGAVLKAGGLELRPSELVLEYQHGTGGAQSELRLNGEFVHNPQDFKFPTAGGRRSRESATAGYLTALARFGEVHPRVLRALDLRCGRAVRPPAPPATPGAARRKANRLTRKATSQMT